MGLKIWKTIKALTELAAVLLGFYVIYAGGDPTLTFIGVMVIILGWEAVELLAVEDELREQLADAVDDEEE